jgi:hypothetical protein
MSIMGAPFRVFVENSGQVSSRRFFMSVMRASEPRVERVAQPVAHQVQAQHHQHDGEPRQTASIGWV